jgi:hypothetical protein
MRTLALGLPLAAFALRRQATLAIVAGVAASRRRRGAPGDVDARLYERGGTRFEVHLGRRADGRRVAVAVSLGRRGARRFVVDESAPWDDFERQAGLRHAAWGLCRDASAGL